MTTDWLSLDRLTQLDGGGKSAQLTLPGDVTIAIESSPNHRDLRVNTGSHITKVELTPEYELNGVLVDDQYVWQQSP
jgi:hypothetical protein